MLDDTLIISCPGSNGGLLIATGGATTRLSWRPSTGLFVGEDRLLLARQDEGGKVIKVLRAGTSSEKSLSDTSLDLHDVFVRGGKTYVAATEQNSILCFDENWNRTTSWSLPGEHDSAHLNSVVFLGDRLLVSVFGRFERHRQYKEGTVGRGEVIDIVSGETFISGLSQPHSLTIVNDLLSVCNSEMQEVRFYQGNKLTNVVTVPGYARGLAAGREKIYVGLSKSRNVDASEANGGRIAVIDRASLTLQTTIDVPVDEIYDIRVIDNIPANMLPGLLTDLSDHLARNEELIGYYKRGFESYKVLSRALYDEACNEEAHRRANKKRSWEEELKSRYMKYFVD